MARADAIWKRLRKSRDNPDWEDSSERGERSRWAEDTIEGELAEVDEAGRGYRRDGFDESQIIDVDDLDEIDRGDEAGRERRRGYGAHADRAGADAAAHGGAHSAAYSGAPGGSGRAQAQAHAQTAEPAEEVTVEEWVREQRRRFPGQTENYLLSFGFPGSGKTTFQSFLVYYLTHIGPFDAHPRIAPLGSPQGWDPMVTFNEWIRLWHQGKFPPANPVDESDIRELAFDIKPLQGRELPLELSLIEVSGEFMARVIAERDHDPDLVEAVAALFDNDQINLVLMFILDPDHGDENDVLFQNLVTFLDVYFPEARHRMSLGIMISKPESSLQRLQARHPEYGHHTELRGQLCEDYVRLMAPRTHRILDSWPKPQQVQLMTLHLGELGSQDGEPRVHRVDYTDIEAIFGWLYTRFTGARLGPGLLQQLIDWLRR
ncbi:hypothetical protein CKO15_01170 [Halorhodospira abdelmalekii]|uniref:hypothetical protein n=1 Tax=Halorhodospira abdelmalekii TaxID=421629 RepID=UPI001903C621|nr:hypothetical protein [Halorhodospira abdelmalekii]MBK1733911.1 hypothetical protein [Halorhodospira abdelmalekii]